MYAVREALRASVGRQPGSSRVGSVSAGVPFNCGSCDASVGNWSGGRAVTSRLPPSRTSLALGRFASDLRPPTAGPAGRLEGAVFVGPGSAAATTRPPAPPPSFRSLSGHPAT